MPRRLSALVLVGAVLVALSTPTGTGHSQATDASIIGTVRDELGAPVSGASITVKNGATGGTWSVVTRASGRFTFVQLPLGGPYEVSVRAIGASPESRAGYVLTLGTRVVVEFRIRRAVTTLTAVNVQATANDTRTSSIGGNHRVDAVQIAGVPAVNRSFTNLAALAPTIGVQLSLLGQRWTSTDVRIDGAQARNMLRAGVLGAGPFTLSLEAIREFEVSASVYDVTQGRQGGGAIRAATWGGTNEWRGSVFSYFRNSGLSAPTDYQSRTREQREFSAVQWGGSVGGPIIRDKVHLFVALDQWNSNEPLYTGLVQTPADELAIGIARDSLTRLMSILGTKYAVDTTVSQIGRLDRAPVSNTIFARLDWKLGAQHRLTLTENLNIWDSPLSGGVDLPVALFEARSNYHTVDQQAVATLHTSLSSGVQNELQFGLSTSQRELGPNSPAPRGFVRIQSRLPNGTTGDARVQFGGNRLAPDDSREVVLQLGDRLNFERGGVLYTLGTDNSLTTLSTYIAEAQSGLFEFQSLTDLDNLRAFRYSRTLPLADPAPETNQKVLETGFFAQAEWRLTPRMTATAGLRWDGTAFLSSPPRNALVEQVLGERTDRAPSDWSKLQPRGSLVWDIDGKGRDVLRVGGGRFAAQPIYYLHHNQLLNDGTRIADITQSGAAVPVPNYASYRSDPSTIPGLPNGSAPPPPYVNLVASDFGTPSVWKGSVSYRRRVGGRLTMTGTVLGLRTTGNYMYVDRNLRATPAFTLANESERPVFVPATTIDAQGRTLNANALVNPQLGRVLELRSVASGTGRSAMVEASMALPREARIEGSYTYNQARDNSTFGCCLARTATTFTAITGDPRDLSGSWGPSDTDFRHKMVVSGTLPVFWGVHVGARYVGSNGRTISAVVNGDINGDEATSNDLAFVFDPDDPATPPAVAASMRKVLDNPLNVARDYLRDNVGRIATRNGAFAPWTERIDLRITKDVRTWRGQLLSIGLDVFNVANLLNSNWGAEYQLPLGISNQNPVVQRLPLLNVVGFNQTTRRYTYSVNENFGVLQKAGNPYQMQLSVRYGF